MSLKRWKIQIDPGLVASLLSCRREMPADDLRATSLYFHFRVKSPWFRTVLYKSGGGAGRNNFELQTRFLAARRGRETLDTHLTVTQYAYS